MEYYRLMESLYLAMEKTKSIKGRESGAFASGAEFSTRLGLSRDRLQKFEMTELENLWIWFAPRGPWDECVGEEGIDLGTEIFQLTERLRSKVK